jgi:hypothetical protein
VTCGPTMKTKRWNLNPRAALVAVTALISAVLPTVFASTSRATTTLFVCPSPASLTDRAAARQLLMLGFTKEDDARLALLARNGIGGFFVMGSRRSDASIKQAGSQIAAIRRGAASAKLTVPFIAVDDGSSDLAQCHRLESWAPNQQARSAPQPRHMPTSWQRSD